MQFTDDIGVKTIEREERWVSKESTRALLAGAIDDSRVGIGDRERRISNNADGDGVEPAER